MARRDSLQFLRPHSGKHAILEAVITLQLSQESPLLPAEDFRALHKGAFKREFPKFEIVRGMEFGLTSGEPVTIQQGELPTIGFGFCSYKSDGSLLQRIRYEKSQAHWIAVNFLEYSRWEPCRKRALDWLSGVAKKIKQVTPKEGVKVSGLSVHYIDHLHWETDAPPPLKEIFNPNSKFLPARLREDVYDWQSRVAYKRKKNSLMHTDSVSVLAQVNPQTKHRRFIIDIPLSVTLAEPVAIGEFLADPGKQGFAALSNSLHSDNKLYMKDILMLKVRRMIGLRS